MKIVWTVRAILDLVEARAYVARDNPTAAGLLARRIVQATTKLTQQPEMGRPGRLRGTRELVITRTPFVIPCRLHGDRVELLRVLHGRREYPPKP